MHAMKKPIPIDIRHKLGLETARLLSKTEAGEYPLRQLFWECTLRCNLRCRHCGSDCKQDSMAKDMPGEDFMKVLDRIAAQTDPHKVFVIVTGGEPLVRTDIERWGAEIYRRGFPWGMVTNGFALTEKRLEKLKSAGIHAMTVSFDGNEEDHDWMRGVQGSYKKAEVAIKNLAMQDDIIWDVVTCVNKRTVGKLDQIKETLIGIGVKNWRVFSVFPSGRAASDPEMNLSGTEFAKMMDFIARTRKEGRIKASYGCEGFLGNYEGEVRDNMFNCIAGKTVGSVLIYGSIGACPSIRSNFSQGNIYKDDFMDVWKNRYGVFRNREWMKIGECADCRYFRYCNGNGMHLRDENGNLMFCHLKKLMSR